MPESAGELAAPRGEGGREVVRPGAGALTRRFGVVAFLIALDLWSKRAVFAWLGGLQDRGELVVDSHGHLRRELLGGTLTFMRSYNPGMAWGFDKLPMHVLVYGRVGAVLFLTWLVARTDPRRRALLASLVLILSGAAGNLYDNLFTESVNRPFGMVRDFIDVYFGAAGVDWHFPTFNVADACISVGAVLLFASSSIEERARRSRGQE